MAQWEYMRIDLFETEWLDSTGRRSPYQNVSLIQRLNQAGQEGWELICVLGSDPSRSVLLLKREPVSSTTSWPPPPPFPPPHPVDPPSPVEPPYPVPPPVPTPPPEPLPTTVGTLPFEVRREGRVGMRSRDAIARPCEVCGREPSVTMVQVWPEAGTYDPGATVIVVESHPFCAMHLEEANHLYAELRTQYGA